MKIFTFFNSPPGVLKTRFFPSTTTKDLRSDKTQTHSYIKLVIACLVFTFTNTMTLRAQSTQCVPGSVMNDAGAPWSEECYLAQDCEEQGNPCQANDVVLLGVYYGDENGGPVEACTDGETVTFLLWGKFLNNTNTDRYAVRSNTEVYINGVFTTELNECSFDVLEPGDTEVALLGQFDYQCGDDIQLLNTWVGWSTSAAQCEDPNALDYKSECGQYPPSKCSKSLVFLDFLAPNFSVECGPNTSSAGTEVAFTNLSTGGTAPLTYHWDFGDGTASVAVNPSHTYPTTNGTYHVIMTVMDALGVEASAQLFLDLDSLSCCSLTVTCPSANGGIFSCVDDIPSPDESLIGILDACGAVSIDVVETNAGTGCGTDTLYITRSYQINDGGETSTCTQIFRVIDTQIPVLTCPANISVACSSLVPAPDPGDLYVIDNCDSAPSVRFVGDNVINQSCTNRYQIIRTYEAVDACGNTDVCTQTITVFDDTPPSIACPAGLTVSCVEDIPAANTGSIITSDGCSGSVVVTVAADQITGFICDNVYTITRVFTATDACGNTSTCAQLIVVDDNSPPTLTCPANITVSCAANIPLANINAIVASDNCGGDVEVSVQPDIISGVFCANEYTVQRVYVATDDCGNSATCLQTITVQDVTPPQLNCPPAVNVSCASDIPSPDISSILSSDNCGAGVSVTVQPDVITGQLCANNYSILRVYVATDACGNSTTCSQIIFVNDNQPPAITCLADLTVSCSDNIPPANTAAVLTSDNCGGAVNVTVAADITIDQSCANSYTVLRTYTALDLCGNSSSCTQRIRVEDLTAPVIECPADLILSCTDNILPVNTGQATATDNCGGTSTVSYTDVTSSSGGCAEAYSITRTWTATDACGNSATCVQVINIVDEVAPQITCPANITVSCASNIPVANVNAVIAVDACDESLIITVAADVIMDQTCDNAFTILRTYYAQDGCGNSSSCTQVITVVDEITPILSCPATITVSCVADVPLVDINLVTTSDNCGGDVVVTVGSDQVVDLVCVNRFTILRTYVATDDCGNSASCTQTIIVSDNVAPVVSCPANLTVTCAAEIPVANPGLITASDNCGGAVTTALLGEVITNQICANNYTLTRTYIATDACGNTATCAQVISVSDNVTPTLSCPADLTVVCADDIPAPNPGSLVAADNCGGAVTVTHAGDVITDATCPNQFTVTRTYLSTDACGNTATCIQLINVDDTQPPAITFTHPLLIGVPNGGTIDVQCFGQDPNWDLPVFNANSISALDQCDVPAIVGFTQTLENEGDCRVDGYINLFRLTWTAEDSCGNSSSAFVFLALIDTIPPVIEGVPADITVSADAIPDLPTVYALDECLCACLIVHEETPLTEGCIDGQVIVRSWRAKDDCGNTTIVSQRITIEDNNGPELALLLPELAELPNGSVLEYSCADGGIPDFYQLLGESSMSTTDYSGPVTMNFRADVERSDNCEFFGYLEKHTFTWEAIDGCGNVSSMSIQALVKDDVAPVITGVPEITCFDSPLLALIEANDDCADLRFTHWDVEIPSPCGEGTAIRRTYEAVDNCGNMTRDTAILIDDDGSAPQLEFVNPILMSMQPEEVLQVSCQANEGQLTSFSSADVIATDGCEAGMQIAFTERILSEANCQNGAALARVELIWIATDHCGNTSQKSVLADIVDDIPPVLVNHEREISIGCNQRMPDIVAVDNCGEVIVEIRDSVVFSLCESQYDVLRLITLTDPCGNVTTDRQWVHVGGTGPVISGVEEEVCNDLSMPVVSALDPCTGDKLAVTMTEDTLSDVCRDGLVIQRIWSAVDACGNVTEITQHIVMNDITPPVITVPQQSIIRKFDDLNDVKVILLSQREIIEALNALNAFSVFVLDDCDTEIIPVFTVLVIVPENIAEAGYSEERIYTWVARDICGNTAILTFTVYILDDMPPVVGELPGNLTIVCEPLPPVPAMVMEDSLDLVTVIFTETIEDGPNHGEFIVIRTWYYTDHSGNQTIVSQRIIWIPETLLDCEILLPAQVDCNSHGVLISSNLTGGVAPFTYIWEIEGDECFIQGGQNTPAISIYVGWSDVNIRLTVIDSFGCSTTCEVVLTCDLGLHASMIYPHADNEAHEEGNSFIASVETLSKLNLWPNPAEASVQLSFEAKEDYPVKYTVFDFLGRQVMHEMVNAGKGRNQYDLDIANLPEGTYWIKVESIDHSVTRKLVIMRN